MEVDETVRIKLRNDVTLSKQSKELVWTGESLT